MKANFKWADIQLMFKGGRCHMKILVVGGGGREHAIITSISKSSKVSKIYCAPGNAGIADLAECVDIGVMEFDKLVAFAKEKEIDLVVVAPDDPLVAGAVDAFNEAGIRAFGPKANAAIIEGSKAFSKDLMKKYGIPTAAYENFTDPDEAIKYLETADMPIVLKADGLALGKGVLICNTLEEAKAGVKEIMLDKHFGNAGNTMVIEEFMTGREVSVLCFCDGTTIKPMTSAQDHKRAKDGDQGLNTGGMGNFSPSPFYTKEVDDFCQNYVYQPTVDAMKAEGRPFKGVIFFGLMLTPKGPRVLEYNARFGDPEAQVVLPRMKNDIIDVFEACIDGTLDQIDLQFADNACVCIVLASNGYPVSYEKGFPIRGLETFKEHEGYYCFHAGTKFKDGEIVTIIGANGAGKSTILSLICRNYDIQKGQILIDGIDIRHIKIASLRSHFGQMLQDVFLFAGDIRSNIVLRSDNVTDEDVWQACRYVNADGFIRKLDGGLDEAVREQGNNFSAGQRQLLSFARTILHKPSVMILDEATANIDTETEVLIQDSLEKMKNIGTMLIVAHRLSTIQHADNIILLSHGEIMEQGTHHELLHLKGRY